jgi:hypothetical protein
MPLPRRRRRCHHRTSAPQPRTHYDKPGLAFLGALTIAGGFYGLIFLAPHITSPDLAMLTFLGSGFIAISGMILMGLATADEHTTPGPRPQQPPMPAPVQPPPPPFRPLTAHRPYPGDPFDLG